MRPCAVRTLTSFHQTLPMLLPRSVCSRLKNLIFVPSARRSQMQTMRRWTLKMMMKMRRDPPRRLSLIVRPVFFCCYTQLWNNSVFDCPFSASAAFQQASMFEPPAGGHKWCSGSIIPTVCVDELPFHQPSLTSLSGIGGFRRHKSNRPQNPTQPEKRSKQQKLSLRTRSLPQLQDRCWMASSSRKGGTWLSRFYHRQAGVVILRLDSRKPISPFQKKKTELHSPLGVEIQICQSTTDAQAVLFGFILAYLQPDNCELRLCLGDAYPSHRR